MDRGAWFVYEMLGESIYFIVTQQLILCDSSSGYKIGIPRINMRKPSLKRAYLCPTRLIRTSLRRSVFLAQINRSKTITAADQPKSSV